MFGQVPRKDGQNWQQAKQRGAPLANIPPRDCRAASRTPLPSTNARNRYRKAVKDPLSDPHKQRTFAESVASVNSLLELQSMSIMKFLKRHANTPRNYKAEPIHLEDGLVLMRRVVELQDGGSALDRSRALNVFLRVNEAVQVWIKLLNLEGEFMPAILEQMLEWRQLLSQMGEEDLTMWQSCVETAIQRHVLLARGRHHQLPATLALLARYSHPAEHVQSMLRLYFTMEPHQACIAHVARFMREEIPNEYRSVLYAVLFQRLKEPEGKVQPEELDRLLHLFWKLPGSCAQAAEQPRRMVLGNSRYMRALVDKADTASGAVLVQLLRSILLRHPGTVTPLVDRPREEVGLRAPSREEHVARCTLAARVMQHVRTSQPMLLRAHAAEALFLLTSSNVVLPGPVVPELLALLMDTLAVLTRGSDHEHRHVLGAVAAWGWHPRVGDYLAGLWDKAPGLKPATAFRLAYVSAARVPAHVQRSGVWDAWRPALLSHVASFNSRMTLRDLQHVSSAQVLAASAGVQLLPADVADDVKSRLAAAATSAATWRQSTRCRFPVAKQQGRYLAALRQELGADDCADVALDVPVNPDDILPVLLRVQGKRRGLLLTSHRVLYDNIAAGAVPAVQLARRVMRLQHTCGHVAVVCLEEFEAAVGAGDGSGTQLALRKALGTASDRAGWAQFSLDREAPLLWSKQRQRAAAMEAKQNVAYDGVQVSAGLDADVKLVNTSGVAEPWRWDAPKQLEDGGPRVGQPWDGDVAIGGNSVLEMKVENGGVLQ